MVKAVFLYIDGTLMDTNYLHVEASARALEEVRDPVPRAVIHEQIGKGSDKLISSLSERGYGVWFAASAEPGELKHHMEALGVEGKIAGVVSSGDAEEAKPSPDIFALALERAGVFPEDAVVVGDSVWDVEAAKEAGVRTAAVMTGGAFSRAELEEAGPTRSTKTATNYSTTTSPRNSTLPTRKMVEKSKER